MNKALADIRTTVGEENLSRSCSGDGCRVYMTDVPSSRVIVDVERVFQSRGLAGKRCDFVLFLQTARNALVIVPVELKSGHADTSQVAGQLQAGAEFAASIVRSVVSKPPAPIFRPVLFHGKKLHPKERNDLNRAKVRIQGVDLSIKTAHCGRPRNLAQALPPHAAA